MLHNEHFLPCIRKQERKQKGDKGIFLFHKKNKPLVQKFEATSQNPRYLGEPFSLIFRAYQNTSFALATQKIHTKLKFFGKFFEKCNFSKSLGWPWVVCPWLFCPLALGSFALLPWLLALLPWLLAPLALALLPWSFCPFALALGLWPLAQACFPPGLVLVCKTWAMAEGKQRENVRNERAVASTGAH